MANVIATLSNVDVSVTTTNNIITVSEADSGSIVSNIVLSNNIVSVATSQNNVIVAEGVVDISTFRASLSNIAPILYNSESGVFSIDANALFSGKTTDDLVEGNTNLYYTTTRANAAIAAYQGNINTAGNITATNFTATSNISTANLNVTNALTINTIVATTGNITTINATTLNGTLGTAAQPNITSLGTLSSLNVNGAAVVNNNITGNILTANTYMITPDLYLGPVSTTTNKRIIAYGNSSIANHSGSGQLYYDPDFANEITSPSQRYGRWFFQNDTTGSAYPIPTSTTDLIEGANLYYTNARVNAYVIAAGLDFNAEKVDDRVANLMQTTGNLTFTYNDSANTLTLSQSLKTQDITEGTSLYFSNARVLSAIQSGNVQLKQVEETVVNNGNASGNITVNLANGTIHTYTLVGNITNITFSNLSVGSTATLKLTQDAVGGRRLETTNLTNWKFVGNVSTLSISANAIDVLSVFYDGSNYIASLVNMNAIPVLQNSQLANSNVIINGQTFPLGSSGTLSTFNTNVTINGNLIVAGNVDYVNVQDLQVKDRTITLNYGNATTANSFIYVDRSGATYANSYLKWVDEGPAFGYWAFSNNGSTEFKLPTSTTDLSEGANLYYTTARANAAIGAYQGVINTTGNITTGGYFFGNGAFLTGIASPYGNSDVASFLATGFGSNNINTTGNISAGYFLGNASAVTGLTTTQISEGANLWYTTARANSAMDNYLIGGTGISYSSGTIALDFTEFNTGNITEGSNLWYTTDRANSAIAAYQGAINTSGNITTSANVQGQYILGNGAFLTGITSGGTVTQINTGENLTGGPITSTGTIGMANTLANVNGVSSETAANLTLTTNKQISISTRQRNGDVTNSANIRGEGYAVSQTVDFFNAPFFSYSGTEQLKTIGINGSITTGSNVITVTSLRDLQNNPLTISNVTPYYVFTDQPTLTPCTFFPPGTYVVSASGSNIFMSANALYTDTFIFNPASPYSGSFGALSPGAYDATTGLLVALESNFDDGGANAQLITYNFLNDQDLKYGYGPNGPIPSNFVYSIGTSSNYSINTNVISNSMFGRTDFSADQTVANFRRGITVGDADLTNRGENDGFQTFGLNIVWDGTANAAADYGSASGIFPQILLKQYTTGTNQATSLTNSGPRMLFIGANGKNTDNPLATYARNNQELGRISWLSTTSVNAAPGTTGSPAYISVVANRDQTTGPGGIGMYLVAAPTDPALGTVGAVGGATARQLWAAAHRGNTIISAGAPFNNNSGNVVFAPARQGANEGNAVLLAQRIVDSACASPHWATIGYDVPTSNTGARISVTNGHNTTAGRNGNLSVALNRRDNGAGFGTKEWSLKLRSGQTDLVLTEDGVIRTTFAGANITTAGNVSASTFLGNINGATGTFTGNISASTVNAAFFVGDGSNITNINYSNANVQQYLAFGLGSNNINTTGNITAGNTIVNGVSFNTAGTTAPSSGQIVYNANYGSHEQGLDGSNVIVMGQDIVAYVHNSEANTLSKGEVVYIFGATGDKASVKRAVNTTDASSSKTLGIVKSDIVTGGTGYVVTQGVANGLNLGAYTEGDSLYLANVAGTFTNVKPQAPEHIVFIGVVEKANAGNGQIYVRVQNGFELDEIHDIKLTSVQQNDILVRNSGNTLWINQNFGTTVTNSNITLKQFQETRVDLGTTNGNITLDMANGSIFAMTANGNISNIALSNAGVGASGTLIITQDGTGSRLLTVTSAWKFAGGSKTLSTAANTIDIVNFFTDGTTVFAALSKGYA